MIAPFGKSSRLVCVSFVLLMTFGPSNCRDPTASSETIEKNATSVQSAIEEQTVGDQKSARRIAARPNWSQDSYLEALRHSRTSTDPREGVVSTERNGNNAQRRREYVPGPVYAGKHLERDSYSLPSHASGDFHGFQNSYGPYGDYATPGYPPSHQAYGPPAPIYGNGLPHGTSESSHVVLPTIDFSWPFALKLNAFTLAKILLKLVIFKMIVKFIAVICLLLFIPKLEIKKKGNKTGMNDDDEDDDDDEDEGRRSWNDDRPFWNRLNALTVFVDNAVDKYQSLNEGRSRDSSSAGHTAEYQRSQQRYLGETWQDYAYLLRNYALEETRYTRGKS